MTREEAERARIVFLAALNESDTLDPIADHVVSVCPRNADGWDICWPAFAINRPEPEIHRACVISGISVGGTTACFVCWIASHDRASRCADGDCQSVMAS